MDPLDNPYENYDNDEDYQEENLFSNDDMGSLEEDDLTQDAFNSEDLDDSLFDDDSNANDFNDLDLDIDIEPIDDNPLEYISDADANDSFDIDHHDTESISNDFYNLDIPIPDQTTYNLSKARFNELNIELVMNNTPTLNSITDDDMFNIMFASLGNSRSMKKTKPTPHNPPSELFANLLSSQNLSTSLEELNISFRSFYFQKIDDLDKDSPGNLNFIELIKTAQTTNGSHTYKSICCTQDFCTPTHLIPLETNRNIKKLFAFELLREELKERSDIQKLLVKTINEYESTLLSVYDKITSIKALKSKSIEDDIITLKIGMMLLAIDSEGYEDLVLHKIINDGKVQPIKDIKAIKKSVLSAERKSKAKITSRKSKETNSFFSSSNQNDFSVTSTTLDDFEADIKARKSQLETLLSKPKPYF